MFGPLALSVVGEYDTGEGLLRIGLPGIPLRIQKGPETAVGQAMRYLSEIAWVPHAVVHNRELSWRAVDGRSAEVATDVRGTPVAVQFHFDEAGDIAGATGTRPFAKDGTFVPTPWGGDFGEYTPFGGVRVPASGKAWWDLPEGRFVYWRGCTTGLELALERAAAITARA
jgi:hypothetical protein